MLAMLQPSGEAPLDEQLAGMEERCREEEVWGQALLHVSEGLTAGRRWLWDEASRKISVLLASPAAFAGEHFLQVYYACWARRIVLRLSDCRNLWFLHFLCWISCIHPGGVCLLCAVCGPVAKESELKCW